MNHDQLTDDITALLGKRKFKNRRELVKEIISLAHPRIMWDLCEGDVTAMTLTFHCETSKADIGLSVGGNNLSLKASRVSCQSGFISHPNANPVVPFKAIVLSLDPKGENEPDYGWKS